MTSGVRDATPDFLTSVMREKDIISAIAGGALRTKKSRTATDIRPRNRPMKTTMAIITVGTTGKKTKSMTRATRNRT